MLNFINCITAAIIDIGICNNHEVLPLTVLEVIVIILKPYISHFKSYTMGISTPISDIKTHVNDVNIQINGFETHLADANVY